MKRLIHIHAKCESFEIFEQVPEKIAVKRLTNIRNSFSSLKSRVGRGDDKLLVKTCVVNPELPFVN